jgi:hypothetical protein
MEYVSFLWEMEFVSNAFKWYNIILPPFINIRCFRFVK